MKTFVILSVLAAVIGTSQAQSAAGRCGTEARHKPVALKLEPAAATATLIGFNEFGVPSTPPRKYRRQVTSGTMYVVDYPDANCSAPTYPLNYSDGKSGVNPPGAPYRNVSWTAALSLVRVEPDGRMLYRAQTSGSAADNKTVTVSIYVDQGQEGNADDVVFENGQEKHLDPVGGRLPFTVFSFSREIAAWGATIDSVATRMVSPPLAQVRDVWNSTFEHAANDPAGLRMIEANEAGLRYVGSSSVVPMSAGGTASGAPVESTYGARTTERLAPLQRVLTGTEACAGGRKVFGTLTQDLSIEDTEEDAEGRAVWRAGSGPVAYRTKRTTGFRIEFQELDYTARFAGCCPGDYNIVVVYTTKPRGSSGPESKPQEVVLRKERFTTSEQVIKGRIRVKAGAEAFNRTDVDYRVLSVEAVRVCTEAPPGSAGSTLGSVHAWFNLGRNALGGSVGQLRIDADDPAGLGSPAALRLTSTAQDGVAVVRGAGGELRQVRAPLVLADIVPLSATSYEIRFHVNAQVGNAPQAGGEFPVTGEPFVRHRVELSDGADRTVLRLSELPGSGGAKVTEFEYARSTGTWTHREGGGLRRTNLAVEVAGADTTKTTTITDAAGTIVSRVARTYRAFAWGEEMIREVIDPGGAALTTQRAYYDDVAPTDPNYGKLKLRIEARGNWERLSYDSEGRVVKRVRPFLHAPPETNDEAQCRVTEYMFDVIPDGDGDGQSEARETTIERVLGVEVARRYEVEWTRAVVLEGDACKRKTEVICTVPSAAWDAAGGLVSEVLTLASGPHEGRERRRVNPDGTAVTTRFAAGANGSVVETRDTGAYAAATGAVVDGQRRVTETSAQGQIVREQEVDIASGRTLTLSVATQIDALGRPTRIDWDDGTYELRDYACCGLASLRDRTGAVTAYVYDALGRQVWVTQNGVGTRSELDADGRMTARYRVGSDGSEMLSERVGLDLAGRRTERRDALGRVTRISESFDAASGITRRVTTQPDGGTAIEVLARDGSAIALEGTAVAPRRWEYGVGTGQRFTREILVGDQGEVSEWRQTFSDAAGRAVRTVFPDGAVEQVFYNAAGQVVREVDPDGVTALRTYNPRGEPEVVAIDLNGNGVIDYAGEDRVTRTRTVIGERAGQTVRRTTAEEWEASGSDSPIVAAVEEVTPDGRRAWNTVRGLTRTTETTLDGAGGLRVVSTGPDGVTVTDVQTQGRLATRTVSHAAAGTLSETTYLYDAHGRMLAERDARRGATQYRWFDDDQVREVEQPDPDPTRTGPGYDAPKTTFTYDGNGRLETVTRSDGGVVSLSYWPNGLKRRVAGAGTYPVEYRYDAQGRMKTLTTWQDYAGDTGRAVTTWDYDAQRGWLNAKRYADGMGPSYSYTPGGRMRTRVWARGTTTTYRYAPGGDLAGVDYSDATPRVDFARDRSGRVTRITDGSGVRELGYHVSGAVEDEVHRSGLLAGLAVDRSFDALHRLSTVAVPGMSETRYGYDAASRIATVAASGELSVGYEFLPLSHLVSRVTARHNDVVRLTTTHAHDRLDRMLSTAVSPSTGGTRSTAYEFDTVGRRVRAVAENNEAWEFNYDGLDQVTAGRKRRSDGVALLGLDFGWRYDDIGNRKTATTNGRVTTYARNLLNQYVQRSAAPGVDVSGAARSEATVTVSYPAENGAVLTTQRQGERFHREVAIEGGAGGRQAAIKVTGVRSGAGPAGEDIVAEETRSVWVAPSVEVFTHDADGNPLADGRWNYAWDAENRLVGMESAASAVAGGAPKQRLEFIYDGQSRRVAKKVFTDSGAGWVLASEARFIYDDWLMLAEVDRTNRPVRTYVWGLDVSGTRQEAAGVGGLLAIGDVASGATWLPGFDGNGNVTSLHRAADGSPVATYDYNAFGEVVKAEGSAALANPIRFSTKYADDETGLVYFGYRYYEAKAGRWVNRDPIEEGGGVNLFAFVGNRSNGTVDPFGLAGYFFDGTGNNRKSGTNVLILHDAYDAERYYFQGVGSVTGTRILGGLTGFGGRNRLNDAYGRFLRSVESGDRYVDIVGFSRGAALAREFANMLDERGYDPAFGGDFSYKINASKNTNPGDCEFLIRFVGLFDTVGSFGAPGNHVNIGIRMDLPATVLRAAQAIAMDEKRLLFPLTPLGMRDGFHEQGFPGDHSDIGRGHGDDTNDLSRAPLEYIWSQGREVDVPFGPLPAFVPTGNRMPHDLSRRFPYNLLPKRPR